MPSAIFRHVRQKPTGKSQTKCRENEKLALNAGSESSHTGKESFFNVIFQPEYGHVTSSEFD